MSIQLIDDRQGWRNRVITNNYSLDNLPNKWNAIKDFINDRRDCNFVIRLEAGGTGKLFVSSPMVGSKEYNLVITTNGSVSLV